MLNLKRCVTSWNSWGAVGDYVRYLFVHPSSRNSHLFITGELSGWGYKSPFTGLQIINNISDNVLFQDGYFTHLDIFRFGKLICFYRYACFYALNGGDNKQLAEALLFWSALPLANALKEVSARIRDSSDALKTEVISFPCAPTSSLVPDDYNARIKKFTDWFKDDFIRGEGYSTLRSLFQIAVRYGSYYDPYLKLAHPEAEEHIISSLAPIIRRTVSDIASY